jgi:hypothetical protein
LLARDTILELNLDLHGRLPSGVKNLPEREPFIFIDDLRKILVTRTKA